MSAPIIDLSAALGGKSWYKSLTVWGLIIFAGATAGAQEACELGAFSGGVCDNIERWGATLGTVMTGLGIRRAATAPNTA